MAEQQPSKQDPKAERAARLKAALKSNLGRRKAQARARAEDADTGEEQE